MNSTRIYGLAKLLGLAALLICTSAVFSAAAWPPMQVVNGTFTLPHETQWGQAVLAPGTYSFTIDASGGGSQRMVVSIQDESLREEGSVLPAGYTDNQNLDRSELIVLHTGDHDTVSALRLADVGVTINYHVPKEERQLISQAPQPQQFEHIAMVASAK
jgi:hypothetical protein